MIYDHRNLLIEFGRVISENETELTRYYYDEAGNRIRKLILRHWSGGGGIPDPPDWGDIENLPIYEPEGEGGEGWSIYKNEFYVRSVGGNELAIYDFDQLEQWNIWGTDNVGKITKEDTEENKYFYLKDHLGSIRAVIDEGNNCVSAQDYDMWGYLLENRTFDTEREKYKYTSKERDEESSYDYFGARYYVSRIGRWGSIDPLFEKHYNFSPYNYVLDNPLVFVDPNGKQLNIIGEGKKELLNFLNIDGTSFNQNRVIFKKGSSTEGFNDAELKIVDLIQGKLKYTDEGGKEYDVEVNAKIMEKPYYIEDGNVYAIPGEGHIGYSIDYENMKVSVTQLFHISTINRLDKFGVYDEEDISRHGIIEAVLAGENLWEYSKAHKGATDISDLNLGWRYESVECGELNGKLIMRAKYKYKNEYQNIYEYDLEEIKNKK